MMTQENIEIITHFLIDLDSNLDVFIKRIDDDQLMLYTKKERIKLISFLLYHEIIHRCYYAKQTKIHYYRINMISAYDIIIPTIRRNKIKKVLID